jgi:hypothetical protein
MSTSAGTSNDAPPTPGEQAQAAQQREREQQRIPSDAAADRASAARLSPDTVPPGTVDRGTDGAGVRGAGGGHRRARPADGTVADGEVEVECPSCGLLLVGESPRPTAAWFCPDCDYPVFWASPNPEPAPPQRRARRRLPGTAGREVLGAEECWHCGERNEPGLRVCPRCAATLPKPTAPTPEPVVVEVERIVTVPHLVRPVTWPFVAAGLLGGSAIAITATLLVLRAAGALAPGALGGLW